MVYREMVRVEDREAGNKRRDETIILLHHPHLFSNYNDLIFD